LRSSGSGLAARGSRSSGSGLAGLKSLARVPLGALTTADRGRAGPASRASSRWRAARSAP